MKNQKIQNISRQKLEIWDEANVRRIRINGNLDELAENIRRNGIKNPLLVKKISQKYKIFAGQRRFLASELINLDALPCRVFDNISLKDAISLSLGENIFSKQMTAIDKANAIESLLQIHKNKNKVCKILGIKSSTLQVYCSYFGLPNEVKNYVDDELVNMQFALKVMRKFSKINAIEILREFVKTKKLSVSRKLLALGINQAFKTDSIDDILRNIKRKDFSKLSVSVYLDVVDAKKLQRIAKKRKSTIENTASDILKSQINKTHI